MIHVVDIDMNEKGTRQFGFVRVLLPLLLRSIDRYQTNRFVQVLMMQDVQVFFLPEAYLNNKMPDRISTDLFSKRICH